MELSFKVQEMFLSHIWILLFFRRGLIRILNPAV